MLFFAALIGSVAGGLALFWTGTWLIPQPWEFLLQQAPVYLSYAAILWTGTWRFLRSGLDAWTWALVLVAYGARPVQFGFFTGVPYAQGNWADVGVFTFPNAATHILLLLSATGCLGWILWALVKRPEFRSGTALWTVVALAAFGGVGLLLRLAADPAPYTALQLLSLVAVRPILLGWAFERNRTAEMLTVLGLWSSGTLLLKGMVGSAVGTSFFEIGVWDLVVLAVSIVFLPVAFGVVSYLRKLGQSRPRQVAASSGDIEPPPPRPPTRTERVIQALLERNRADPAQWVPSHELAAAANVTDG